MPGIPGPCDLPGHPGRGGEGWAAAEDVRGGASVPARDPEEQPALLALTHWRERTHFRAVPTLGPHLGPIFGKLALRGEKTRRTALEGA